MRGSGSVPSSVGHQASGIELDGIRDIGGILTVYEILERTAIERIASQEGSDLGPEEIVDTQNWIRPVLKDGLVTLEIIPVNGHWRAPHKKKPKGKKAWTIRQRDRIENTLAPLRRPQARRESGLTRGRL